METCAWLEPKYWQTLCKGCSITDTSPAARPDSPAAIELPTATLDEFAERMNADGYVHFETKLYDLPPRAREEYATCVASLRAAVEELVCTGW